MVGAVAPIIMQDKLVDVLNQFPVRRFGFQDFIGRIFSGWCVIELGVVMGTAGPASLVRAIKPVILVP
jgi:hypothetical protein